MRKEIPDLVRQKTLLVLDDLPSARKIVTRFLHRLGFDDVLEASSLQEARDVLEEEKLVLIIADIHLKDGLGFSLMDVLKKQQQDIPILFITSDLDPQSLCLTLHLGQKMDYILKPFSDQILAAKIGDLF
jgi:response regulator of citrate/malate metabolism